VISGPARALLALLIMIASGCGAFPFGAHSSPRESGARRHGGLPPLVVAEEDLVFTRVYTDDVRVGAVSSLARGEVFVTLAKKSTDSILETVCALYDIVVFVPAVLLGLPPLLAYDEKEWLVTATDWRGRTATGRATDSVFYAGTFMFYGLTFFLWPVDPDYDWPSPNPDLRRALEAALAKLDSPP
jgi:hypothetical protein